MSNAPYDAIIVLGAAVWSDGTASPALKRRALHAANLFKAGKAPKIICSGGLGKHPPTEAEVISAICIENGVPAEAVLLEDKSTSTLENVRFSLPVLKSLNAKSVLVVSDSYHLPRAKMCFRHFGIESHGSPPQKPSTLSTGRKAFMQIREWLAVSVYFVRLKIGGRG